LAKKKRKQKMVTPKQTGAIPTTIPTQPTSPPPGGGQQAGGLPVKDRPQVVPLIEQIEQLRESRVLTYFLDERAVIAADAMRSAYNQLRQIGKTKKIDLWIHSHGGATEVPWLLVQMIREYCEAFGVLVTELAQSAATHIALGADEIVMGSASRLSPVDPQRQHPLLPRDKDPITGKERPLAVSVQDLKHAVEFIKREAGEEGLSGEAYAQVISALFDKVHPLAVGAIEQSYSLSKLITKRMLSTHMDEDKDGKEIERLTNTLCDDYKSHSFPIARLEARRLGLKVVDANDDLYAAMWALLDYYESLNRAPQPLPAGTVVVGAPSGTKLVYYLLGHIDTTACRYDCIAMAQVAQDGTQEGRGNSWVKISP
jgi:hypothetical protein